MKNDFHLFLSDVMQFESENWFQLAGATKFQRSRYTEMQALLTDRLVEKSKAARKKKPSNKPPPKQPYRTDFRRMDYYGLLLAYAETAYLGARAAVIENRKSSFGTFEDHAARIEEAMGTGALLKRFVTAGIRLVNHNLLEAGGELIDVEVDKLATSILMRATDNLFDPPQDLMNEIAKHKPFQPQPETYIQVVREEIGVMPDFLRKIFIDTLTFKPKL